MDPTTQSRTEQYSDPSDHEGVNAARRMRDHVERLKEYIAHYTAAQKDLVKAKVRKIVFMAMLGAVLGIVGLTMLIVASVYFLGGLAGLISHLLNTGPWAGDLIVGGLLLAAAILGTWMVVKKMTAKSLKGTVSAYEQRKQEQRRHFGKDVESESARR